MVWGLATIFSPSQLTPLRFDRQATGVSQSISIVTCPASIPVTCTSKRSLNTKRDQIVAKPQPAALPVNMRSLAGLKKSKLAARALKASEMVTLMEEPSF
ncbi:hypothetical protein FRB95_011445 [Tulasnella sp. JGI-2019a]|nr:hypothetical protein FRB95_011445 [Tulasnella sp. JGI-2019a]